MSDVLVCVKCGESKSSDGFYRTKTGLDKTCKECRKKRVRENRLEKIDYYTEYEKSRATLEHRRKARSDYQKTHEGIEALKRGRRAYNKRHPEKREAHIIVNNAIRDGKIERQHKCSECGSGCKVEAHHDSYKNPLDVRWLCKDCHNEWHRHNTPVNWVEVYGYINFR